MHTNIIVHYNNHTQTEYKSFDEITNQDLITDIYCSSTGLASLPENMNFPNLKHFNLEWNKLVSLPFNMNFHNLKELNFSSNNLRSLPENMNLI